MRKFFLLFPLAFLLACQSSTPINTAALTDRERDGLRGAVKAVLTEDAILIEPDGKQLEGQQAWSVAVYDQAGKRVQQTPYRVFIPGGHGTVEHEAFFDAARKAQRITDANRYTQHDAAGNVTEAGVTNPQAVTTSIAYEFDPAGNWIKRTIARAAGGQASPHPAEVGHRYFIYFDAPPFGLTAPVSAVEAVAAKNPFPFNQATAQTLYQQKCAACHIGTDKSVPAFTSALPSQSGDTPESKGRLNELEIHAHLNEELRADGANRAHAFKGRISDEAIWQISAYAFRLWSGAKMTDAAATIAEEAQPTTKANADAPRRYPFRGRVVSIERSVKQVMVEHEEVKGYMGAMTMGFPLADEAWLDKLKKDDLIEAVLVVDAKGWRLEKVVVK